MGKFEMIAFTLMAALSGCLCGPSKNCTLDLITVTEKELNVSEIDMIRADASLKAYMSGSACVINMSQIYTYVEESIVPVNDQYYIYIVFVCYDRTDVDIAIADLNDTYASKYMLRLIFKRYCVVTLNTLTTLSLSNSTVITDLYIEKDQLIGRLNQSCVFANTLRTLDFSLEDNVTNILDICQDNFTALYGLFLRSASVEAKGNILTTGIIRSLKTRFPNVQQFRTIDLLPAEKITFPWTSVIARLGDNFGRTIHFVQEPDNETIDILPHNHTAYEYERWFKFQMTSRGQPGSTVNDLFRFEGAINEIVITDLAVKSFKRNCFPYAQHLHTLTISSNGLQLINAGQFRGLSNMIKLDISHNYLVTLDSDVFEDLVSLIVLNLSHNRLIKLQNSLLRNCKSLELIHLENNQLKALTDQFFKPIFFTLKSVYLAFNPMFQVPSVLIYAPNIYLVDMHNTIITGQSLMDLIASLDEPDMDIRDTVKSFTDSNNPSVLTDFFLRKLDISFCLIRSILEPASFYGIAGDRILLGLNKLLALFYIDFWGNPFYCACNITNLQGVLQNAKNQSSYPMSTEKTMICSSPAHLKGRQLTSIRENEMYCPVKLSDCPSNCVCSLREDNSTIIVNCQNLNVTTFPDNLPKYALELWFQNTSIQQISPRKYFGDVVVLDIRNSKVNYISPTVFGQMKQLRSLYLESNLITTLPVQITYVQLKTLTLRNNPFLCDCRLKWLKEWLLNMESVVQDWEHIKCTDGSAKGTQLIALKDTEFTCSEEATFDSVRHVFLPSVVIGCLLVVLVTVSLLVYFQRLTVKVLLYVYCGIHPFDVDIKGDMETTEKFDAVAVYDFDDMDFIQENVIHYLTDKGYNVVDMYRDFIVGLSFIENVKHFVGQSRRVIMCLSTNTLQDELMHLTWSLAYEKTLHSKANFIILIKNNCNANNVKDKQMRRYLKNRRFIEKSSPMFQRCLEYFMPKSIERPEEAQIVIRNTETYIVYPDTLHAYVRHELIPNVRAKTGIELGLFEFQFMPGNALDEEILEVLDRSHRLVFILSNETLRDEIKMMILKNAISKSMDCDYNYLLVFTSGEIFESEMRRDIKNYVNNHVTVRVEDTCFLDRLSTALTTEYSANGELENFVAMDEGVNIPLV